MVLYFNFISLFWQFASDRMKTRENFHIFPTKNAFRGDIIKDESEIRGITQKK
jgi:hypothetical protein